MLLGDLKETGGRPAFGHHRQPDPLRVQCDACEEEILESTPDFVNWTHFKATNHWLCGCCWEFEGTCEACTTCGFHVCECKRTTYEEKLKDGAKDVTMHFKPSSSWVPLP